MRIGELARRTGVSTHLLRVWEDRYRLLIPGRAANGYRTYTAEDEQRVLGMVRLRDQGVGAAVAAELMLDAALARSQPVDLDVLCGDLLAAFAAYDEARAKAVMDLALAGGRVDQILDRVFLPALRHLGDAWAAGEISVAQEHYASGQVRAKMMSLAPELGRVGAADDTSPLAVLACTPHERHDIGLLALDLLLRIAGWRVRFLGADTPVESSTALTEELGADVLVLCGTEPRMFAAQLEQHVGALVRLSQLHVTLVVAGPAATPAVAGRLGAVLLPSDPREAADRLALAGSARTRGPR